MQITIKKRPANGEEEDQRARKMRQLMAAEPELEAIPEEVAPASQQQPASQEPAVPGGSSPAFSSDEEPAGAGLAAQARVPSPSPSFSDLSD